MKTYMVWAFIEEEEDDEYQDTSTPKLLGTFDNEDDSRKFVNGLAATPDLLEACQKVKNLANRLLDYGEIDQEIAGELLLIVNPIIKKAGAE